MCGQCRNVFNAFEALKRSEDTGTDAVIDYALVDSKPTAAQAGLPLPDMSDTSDALPPVEPAEADGAVPSDLCGTGAITTYKEALRKLEQAEQTAPMVDALDMAGSAVVARYDTPPVSGAEPVPIGDPASSDKSPVKSTLPEDPAPRVATATDNPLISGALPRQSSPSRAWRWLVVVAGAVLLAQVIYFYRSQIAQHYPQLRPVLATACEVIGCAIHWGRDQTLIEIESSDLIPSLGRPSEMLLTATLANRAATKQDYPALEIKLTNANNAVLSSRVLIPAEYLGRTPAGEEGMAPNAALYINLNLEFVGKSPASGYGLRAFYP